MLLALHYCDQITVISKSTNDVRTHLYSQSTWARNNKPSYGRAIATRLQINVLWSGKIKKANRCLVRGWFNSNIIKCCNDRCTSVKYICNIICDYIIVLQRMIWNLPLMESYPRLNFCFILHHSNIYLDKHTQNIAISSRLALSRAQMLAKNLNARYINLLIWYTTWIFHEKRLFIWYKKIHAANSRSLVKIHVYAHMSVDAHTPGVTYNL